MDDRRFDHLTRTLAGGLSRRGLLGCLFGVAIGHGVRPGLARAACPPGQVQRRGVGCVCAASGRPPTGAGCPGDGSDDSCPAGRTRCRVPSGWACLDIAADPTNCGGCGVACPPSADPCLVPVCRGGACGLAPGNDGAPCDDRDACTRMDTCRGGACVGSDPVVCAALDQCHVAGTCDPATGACSNPAKADGTPCDDGDPCTEVDACRDGVCVGEPVACDDGLACTASACDPATGDCVHPLVEGWCLIDGACVAAGTSHPDGPCRQCDPGRATDAWSPAAAGTPCGTADRCDGDEACDGAGQCVPGIPVACPDPLPCQEAGVCDPETGACAYELKAAGTVCRAARGACEADAVCDGERPECPANPVAVGRACDDGDPCTEGDACQPDGTCVGTPKACADGLVCTTDSCGPDGVCVHRLVEGFCLIGGACYLAGQSHPTEPCRICDPTTSPTEWSLVPSGSACDDNNACTLGPKRCDAAGICQPAANRNCSFETTPCQRVTGCDPSLGCMFEQLAVGELCDDGNRCTVGPKTCDATGACVGGRPADCDDGLACTENPCDPRFGCLEPRILDGWCLVDGICAVAAATNPANPCQVCDPAQSVIAWSNRPQGTSCDDDTLCNGRETCDGAGTCRGGVPVVCAPPDECQEEGVCDPASGECSYVLKPGWCRINGACVAADAPNPASSCQSCQPAVSTTTWSARAGAACNLGGADGVCCADGNCCPFAFCSCCNGLICVTPNLCRFVDGGFECF